MRAEVADLKDHLSRRLDHVRSGGTVLVLHARERGADPPTLEFVTLDDQQAQAAEREGLQVLGPR